MWEFSQRDEGDLYDGLTIRGYGEFVECAMLFRRGALLEKTISIVLEGSTAHALFSECALSCDLLTLSVRPTKTTADA